MQSRGGVTPPLQLLLEVRPAEAHGRAPRRLIGELHPVEARRRRAPTISDANASRFQHAYLMLDQPIPKTPDIAYGNA
jgi:hypothetical protein